MNYLQYSIRNRRNIEKALSAFFKKKQAEPMPIRFYSDVLDRLLTFSQAGKLMRGIFVVAAYEMCLGTNTKSVLQAACAIEVVHTGLLIHDDIMDRDELRRGLRTIYMQYSDEAQRKKIENSLDYGQSMGISAGDVAFFLATELLMNAAIDMPKPQRFMNIFSSEMVRLGVAQMEDVHMGNTQKAPTPDEIIQMYLYKSARYSFSLPFAMGALLAGAPRSVENLLIKLGEQIGIIFQLKDDEIGLFGSSKNIGKSVGIDIYSNKKTLHRHYCYQYSTREEKSRLSTIFGNASATREDIEYVMSVMNKYNIRKCIQDLMKPYENEAYHIIDTLERRGMNVSMFKGIVELNMNRNK